MDSTTTAPIIRAYTPADRDAIRQICCDTADSGRPLDLTFFPDPELFADLLTSYFTDYQSDTVWVADAAGEVVGYLTGCPDTAQMHRITRQKVMPGSFWRAVLRGTFFRWATWRLLWSNGYVWLESALQRQAHVKNYPAQLHVNLKPGQRGRHVGRDLVLHFLQQARERHIPGVEASVREDNVRARNFFEGLGFVPLRRLPLLVRHGRMLSSVIYGKTL